MNSYTLFKTIHECGRDAQYTDVINALRAKGFDASEAKELLEFLVTEGYLKGQLNAYQTVSLTPKGVMRLLELAECRQQKIEERTNISSENRKQRKMEFIAGLCGTGFGAILGYILNAIL